VAGYLINRMTLGQQELPLEAYSFSGRSDVLRCAMAHQNYVNMTCATSQLPRRRCQLLIVVQQPRPQLKQVACSAVLDDAILGRFGNEQYIYTVPFLTPASALLMLESNEGLRYCVTMQ
jgi:hypothetical protein